MLILSRKCLESLIIADRIVVTILGIDGAEVQLGIDAPSEVVITRAEGEPPSGAAPMDSAQSVASGLPGGVRR